MKQTSIERDNAKLIDTIALAHTLQLFRRVFIDAAEQRHILHPNALEYLPQTRVPCWLEHVFEVEVHSDEFGVLFHGLF